MVVRTGLRAAMGDMLRQVMAPLHHTSPYKDPFIVVGHSKNRCLCSTSTGRQQQA